MSGENICKFNMYRASDLICHSFILEAQQRQAEEQVAAWHMLALGLGGEGLLTLCGEEHTLCEGTLFFVPKGECFSVSSTEAFVYSYIPFDGRRADEYVERLGLGRENCIHDGYAALVPFWREGQQMADEGNIDIVCEAVLLFSLAKLKPVRKKQGDAAGRTVAYVQEHFADPDLTVSKAAAALGYDAKYLSSLFKKRQGISFSAFVQNTRVRHAVFLMEQGVGSVKNVAWLCGFRDALYFSKIFSRIEGISPRAYITRLTELNTDDTGTGRPRM